LWAVEPTLKQRGPAYSRSPQSSAHSLLNKKMLATAASAVLKMFPAADWNWVAA